MRIRIPSGGYIVIDDETETAQKIRDGYRYSVVDGVLTIGAKMNLDDRIANADSIDDLKNILLHIVQQLRDGEDI